MASADRTCPYNRFDEFEEAIEDPGFMGRVWRRCAEDLREMGWMKMREILLAAVAEYGVDANKRPVPEGVVPQVRLGENGIEVDEGRGYRPANMLERAALASAALPAEANERSAG